MKDSKPDTSAFARSTDSAWLGNPTVGQNTFFQTLEAVRRQERARPGDRVHGRWVRWRMAVRIVTRASWEYAGQFAGALRWLMRRWLNQNPGRLTQMAEVVLWPLALISLSWWTHPANPLYVNEGFPWPWLGTWLVALRYGVLAGVVGVLEMLLAWWLSGTELPRLYFLGGAIATLLAGEFGGFWGTRTRRYKESVDYLNEKIERLTRRLYLLKLSHDELEYEMVDRPGTLRDALMGLRELMEQERRKSTRLSDGVRQLPAAKAMLTLLAHYTQVEAAGMYLIRKGPVPELDMVAKIGPARAPQVTDFMVLQAVQTRQSVHVQDAELDHIDRNSCLLVAPLLDEEGEAFGLLAVNRMPFMGVHHDNLRHIWVLVQAYSEYLRSNRLGEEYAELWPKAPLDLRQEFARLSHLNLHHGIESHCIVWRIFSRRAPVIAEHLRQAHHGGELVWLFRTGEEVRLVSLFVFADVGHVAVAITRILEAARQRGGLSAEAIAKVSTEEISLGLPRAYELMVNELNARDADSSLAWENSA